MLQVLLIFLFFLCAPIWGQLLADEAIYTINGKKVLHTVSEKFVSFSIDPAILLTGLNLSDATLRMAKHLAPAYVRIAGPSTQFVKYQEESWRDEENGFVSVTPSMWFGINEWLASANLTPVFGINDKTTSQGEWNPQEAMDVLDLADKFNVSCYWQLGYDCSNKTPEQYETDLKRLQHVLDAFPGRKEQWKIVGSDVSRCSTDSRKVIDDLSNVLTAVVQESPHKSFNDLYLKPKVPLWATSPKSPHAVSFSSAIFWAKDMGEAAKNGYEVILKRPRLHEIYSETPPFWVSLFHKMLIGRNVLEVKPVMSIPEIWVYAHCTKHQNEFVRSGAMTVLAVNNCTRNHTVLVKFGTLMMKSTEVQSYILTSESEDATDVFLNGEKLTLDMFSGDRLNVLPKLRRARILNYLSLFLPPKSVGFFVLPSAQIPICSSEEESDLRLLMEEIREDQNIHLTDEETVEVTPRFSFHRSPTLRQIQDVMEKELQSDEKFYKHRTIKKNRDEDKGRNLFVQRMLHKPHEEIKRHEELKLHKEEAKKIFELELTSAEIRKVLADRAKVKAARKNIIFTSDELEEIMNKATHKFLNSKNASIRIRKKTKRETKRDKKDINMKLLKLKSIGDRRRLRQSLKQRRMKNTTPEPMRRRRRDINMDLLKLKSDLLQKTAHKKKKPMKKFENLEEKQATIRQPEQTSEEFLQLQEELEEEEEESDSPLPDQDVFADLAGPDDFIRTTTERNRIGFKPKSLFHLGKPAVPKITVQPVQYDPKKITLEDDFQATEEEGDGFDCIHEFFGTVRNDVKVKENSSELWEIRLEEPKNNSVPSLTNRLKMLDIEAVDAERSPFEEYIQSKSAEDGIEDDYEDLESDESRPLRLKRDIQDKNLIFLGKAYDPAKLKIDYNMKSQQYKMLKDHLYQKKKLAFIDKANKRKSRSLPRQNTFNDRYKSLSDGLKVWRPSDILTLKKKIKRSLDHDADSVENEIGNFMHELVKDAKVISEDGDYQLIFPNKDKIQVAENQGDTEVKLVLHGEGIAATAIPERESVEQTTKSNIQKISKKHEGNIWRKLFGKVSKFFQGLSTKLKRCIMDDLLNGA